MRHTCQEIAHRLTCRQSFLLLETCKLGSFQDTDKLVLRKRIRKIVSLKVSDTQFLSDRYLCFGFNSRQHYFLTETSYHIKRALKDYLAVLRFLGIP